MYGRRSGRVQVNVLQYMELVERVEALEKIVLGSKESEMTKPEVMEALDKLEIKYNPRDKKEVLIDLLNSQSEE